MPWAVAAAAVGAVATTAASSKASKAQTAAADSANATQLAINEQNREDQAPWRDAGEAGLNELQYRLGLSMNRGGASAASSNGWKSEDQIYQDLLEQWDASPATQGSMKYNFGVWDGSQIVPDSTALRSAANRQFSSQTVTQADAENEAKSDPAYNSLLRNFTAQDMEADPVYQSGLQFGLDEGRKGVNNQLAANGNMLSGAALKALTRFGNDYASTKANDSYNRFNNNQSQIYNRLAGISGTGQTAANQIANQGSAVANNIASNQIGVGNARAASAIGQGNAISGAIGQGVNMWQQQNALTNMRTYNSPNNYGGGYNFDGSFSPNTYGASGGSINGAYTPWDG